QIFRRNPGIFLIYAVNLRSYGKGWNRKRRHWNAGDFQHARSVSAPKGSFGFTPPAARKQGFARGPFGGIDGNEVHIAVETAMLETVIENKDVPELFFLCQAACFIAIRSNQNRDISQAAFDQ